MATESLTSCADCGCWLMASQTASIMLCLACSTARQTVPAPAQEYRSQSGCRWCAFTTAAYALPKGPYQAAQELREHQHVAHPEHMQGRA